MCIPGGALVSNRPLTVEPGLRILPTPGAVRFASGSLLESCNEAALQSAEERRQFIKGVMAKIVDVDANEVASIDWWCGKISDAGKELRTGPATHKHSNRRASLAPRLSR